MINGGLYHRILATNSGCNQYCPQLFFSLLPNFYFEKFQTYRRLLLQKASNDHLILLQDTPIVNILLCLFSLSFSFTLFGELLSGRHQKCLTPKFHSMHLLRTGSINISIIEFIIFKKNLVLMWIIWYNPCSKFPNCPNTFYNFLKNPEYK